MPSALATPLYGLLAFGDQKERLGADLNAAWHLRDGRIFAKLTQIAQPR